MRVLAFVSMVASFLFLILMLYLNFEPGRTGYKLEAGVSGLSFGMVFFTLGLPFSTFLSSFILLLRLIRQRKLEGESRHVDYPYSSTSWD